MDGAFDLRGYYTKISLVVLLLDVLNLCVLQAGAAFQEWKCTATFADRRRHVF